MVSLPLVQASNARAAAALPGRLVAVFAGATSGIGEASLREFVRCSARPRVYFVGRSREAGERIAAELAGINPAGEYNFVAADASLLRNVDEVCRGIREKEECLNLLFLSQGTLKLTGETPEGLPYNTALSYYGRTRFIANLLPLLRRARGLRRVVTVLAGGKEGRIDTSDFTGRHVSLCAARGHHAGMTTLSLVALAARAPEVSFVHSYPGGVDTPLIRPGDGAVLQVGRWVFKGALLVAGGAGGIGISARECGERHAFLCTSARYPPGKEADGDGDDGAAAGVPRPQGVEVARGVDGRPGSGVYASEWDDGDVPPAVDRFVAGMREEGVLEKMWAHTEGEFRRITGSEAI